MSTYYRNIQTIKHALQYYITRENASEKDLIREKNLLKKIEEEVDEYKERKNIRFEIGDLKDLATIMSKSEFLKTL